MNSWSDYDDVLNDEPLPSTASIEVVDILSTALEHKADPIEVAKEQVALPPPPPPSGMANDYDALSDWFPHSAPSSNASSDTPPSMQPQMDFEGWMPSREAHQGRQTLQRLEGAGLTPSDVIDRLTMSEVAELSDLGSPHVQEALQRARQVYR